MERFRVDRLDGFEWRIFDQSSLALRVHKLVILSISFEKRLVAATKNFQLRDCIRFNSRILEADTVSVSDSKIREIWSGGF